MASRAKNVRSRKPPRTDLTSDSFVRAIAFYVSVSALVLTPLVFSTSVYRTFSLPKFLTLLCVTAALIPLVAFGFLSQARRDWLRPPASKHILLVCAFVVTVTVSTVFGARPAASFFGSFESQMGLVTRLCFFVCFLSLIFGIGRSRTRLMQTIWAMVLTGLVTATYAFVQFFGKDPILPSSVYTLNSGGQSVVRAIGTLGHPDYLGNFLLYTTPLAAGLAVGSRGRTRRLAIVAAALSTAAIAFSGTRGAWLGLIAGGVIFITSEIRLNLGEPAAMRRRLLQALIGCLVVALSALLIASNAASRNIAVRARLLVTEGFTGSGRTLLWRDSLRMAPMFVIAGCGPEGFREAFLAYKSSELARFAPDINNESSHNSYLDAAISFGLPGAALYAAIIASTFLLMRKARRSVADGKRRAVIAGLLSAFAAVAVHNFFIFDQIPTGLYFFAFAALGCAVVRVEVTGEKSEAHDERGSPADTEAARRSHRKPPAVSFRLILAASFLLSSISVYYSFLLTRQDLRIKEAFAAANVGDLDRVQRLVNGATRDFDPTGDYHFTAARVLTICAERTRASSELSRATTEKENLMRAEAASLDQAIAHAKLSLSHTLTSDSSYLLLAYLHFLKHDSDGLRLYAGEALRRDPRFPNARWLMAEAHLANGDLDGAAREAQLALDINPSLRQARSALARARGEAEGPPTVEQAVEWARFYKDAGQPLRAERMLRRAIARSLEPCVECHLLLASIYEEANRYDDALTEWETVIRVAPDRASAAKASARIESLKKKMSPMK